MSLEQSIAALTAQAGLLLDLPQTIANTAQAQITMIGNAYQGWLASHYIELWVHPVTGNDLALGTALAPMKTIKAALAKAPETGHIVIRLLADYPMNAVEGAIGFRNRVVHIYGSDVAGNIVERRVTNAWANPAYTFVSNFYLESQACICVGLRFVLPVGTQVQGPDAIGWRGAFFTQTGETSPISALALRSCAYECPAGGNGWLIANTFGTAVLGIASITYTTADVAGKWVYGLAAGTDPKTRPDVVLTRLATV